MAIIRGGSPMGEIRGKLGASVFSRNKAGQIIRAYAKPTDAATQAQIQARSNFAQSMNAFHTLTPAQKAAWNSFAAQYFNSKTRGVLPSVHSGVNAFVSLRNVALNINRTMPPAGNPVNVSSQSVLIGAATVTPIVPSLLAPNTPMQGVLGEGNILIDSIDGVSWQPSSSTITFGLNVTMGGVGPTPDPYPDGKNIFIDPDGRELGFAIYVSNQFEQTGTFVNNPDIALIGNTGLLNIQVGALPIAFTKIEIEIDGGAYIDNSSFQKYKTGWQENELVQYSIWMFNQEGQVYRIGSFQTSIEEA